VGPSCPLDFPFVRAHETIEPIVCECPPFSEKMPALKAISRNREACPRARFASRALYPPLVPRACAKAAKNAHSSPFTREVGVFSSTSMIPPPLAQAGLRASTWIHAIIWRQRARPQANLFLPPGQLGTSRTMLLHLCQRRKSLACELKLFVAAFPVAEKGSRPAGKQAGYHLPVYPWLCALFKRGAPSTITRPPSPLPAACGPSTSDDGCLCAGPRKLEAYRTRYRQSHHHRCQS